MITDSIVFLKPSIRKHFQGACDHFIVPLGTGKCNFLKYIACLNLRVNTKCVLALPEGLQRVL